jgi:hypothetical protein
MKKTMLSNGKKKFTRGSDRSENEEAVISYQLSVIS